MNFLTCSTLEVWDTGPVTSSTKVIFNLVIESRTSKVTYQMTERHLPAGTQSRHYLFRTKGRGGGGDEKTFVTRRGRSRPLVLVIESKVVDWLCVWNQSNGHVKSLFEKKKLVDPYLIYTKVL